MPAPWSTANLQVLKGDKFLYIKEIYYTYFVLDIITKKKIIISFKFSEVFAYFHTKFIFKHAIHLTIILQETYFSIFKLFL